MQDALRSRRSKQHAIRESAVQLQMRWHRLREPESGRWGNVPAGAVGSRELRRGVGGGVEGLRRRWSLGMEVAMHLNAVSM
jgi:hypothetical protein